jgi:hypothetical protein
MSIAHSFSFTGAVFLAIVYPNVFDALHFGTILYLHNAEPHIVRRITYNAILFVYSGIGTTVINLLWGSNTLLSTVRMITMLGHWSYL